jgi:hypothetical protein
MTKEASAFIFYLCRSYSVKLGDEKNTCRGVFVCVCVRKKKKVFSRTTPHFFPLKKNDEEARRRRSSIDGQA